jgi:hypothetical protein
MEVATDTLSWLRTRGTDNIQSNYKDFLQSTIRSLPDIANGYVFIHDRCGTDIVQGRPCSQPFQLIRRQGMPSRNFESRVVRLGHLDIDGGIRFSSEHISESDGFQNIA